MRFAFSDINKAFNLRLWRKRNDFRRALSAPGFSLVEVVVVLLIFSVLLSGIFSAYLAQLKNSTREYKFAETDIDLGIARNIIERDIAMAGYGLADDYTNVSGIAPFAAQATNGNPDTLTLMGTALGMKSRSAQAWTYISAVDGSGVPTFNSWGDAREDVRANPSDTTQNDAVILMEPSQKKLLTQGTSWLFKYSGSPANLTTLPCGSNAGSGTVYGGANAGTLVYGLQKTSDTAPAVPYYTVKYSLSNTNLPSNCASGTYRLMRAETTSAAIPADGTGDPVLACVLDFEVAFGLDTSGTGTGTISLWDDGGQAAAAYATNQTLEKNLKQVRVYMLIQSGNYDPLYTYPAASVRVGEAPLTSTPSPSGIGRDVPIAGELTHYRWKVVEMHITPRNVR